MSINYVKPVIIDLKSHPELNEKWVQEIIAQDPSILGIGDLILKDKERIQPRSGRLDLLLQDFDAAKRFEVEIQLGKTDESHIIRTIEYWDVERKRYPQYDHCAVIVAEDITSRFLNVISLFNGAVPLIAIQMSAIKVGNNYSLLFTTVLNQLTLGLVDEDEEVSEVTDRSYWEKIKGTKQTVAMADEMLNLIHTFAPSFELKYNKFYIGLAANGQPNNFAVFRPQRIIMRMDVKLEKSVEVESEIESVGLNMLDYDNDRGRYRIKIAEKDIKKNSEILINLLKMAFEK